MEPGSSSQQRQHARDQIQVRPGRHEQMHPVRQHNLQSRVRAPVEQCRTHGKVGSVTARKPRSVSPPNSPRRTCRRHVQSSARLMSCCRETRVTLLPGASHSATSRSFSSTLHRRRRSTPVMISIRSSALKNVLKLALKIRNHRSPQQGCSSPDGYEQSELKYLFLWSFFCPCLIT